MRTVLSARVRRPPPNDRLHRPATTAVLRPRFATTVPARQPARRAGEPQSLGGRPDVALRSVVVLFLGSLSAACGPGGGGDVDGHASDEDASVVAHDIGAGSDADRRSDDAAVVPQDMLGVPRDMLGPPQDISMPDALTCPMCQQSEVCFTVLGYQPSCLRTCRTNADCIQGHRCISLHRDPNDIIRGVGTYNMNDPACLNAKVPAPLQGTDPQQHCDIFAVPQCTDAMTVKSAVTGWGSCGWEWTHCSKGCSSDGGMFGTGGCN